ncbi:MAG TPA: class I SAM-dependent methyltransferase [Acidimicrobiales bacterium]|nr:class I SAM-dependent methyltransferase [Acidimicrobiales bacterium]
MDDRNHWLELVESNPGHSEWYIERFRTMEAQGKDLAGEARMIDAMVPRRSRILDAGCGPGRVGGFLSRLGHEVVGVDLDPQLIEAAREDHPEPTWLHGDLAELDLGSLGLPTGFHAIVCAGNVMTFLAPSTRRPVLARLAEHLLPEGRLVVGFGAARGYEFADFFTDAESSGLSVDLRLSTWDLRPLRVDSDFLVAVLSRVPDPRGG